MRGLLFVFALAVLGPAAAAQDAPTVVAVRFEGNRRYTDDFLKEQISTKEGELYDPGLLARDERVLRDFFSRVLEIEENRVEGGVEVVFHVLDSAVVGDVELRGLARVGEDDIEDLLVTRPGRPLLDHALESDRDLIERLHREEGYHFVEVRPVVRPRPDSEVVDVVFQVFPNERVRVKEVILDGAHSLDRSDLLGVVKNSDLYRTKLLGLGKLFSPVYFDRRALEEDRRRLEFFYRQEGFLDARVVLADVSFDPDREFATIRYRVDEGVRYTVGELRVVYGEGGGALPEDEDLEFLAPERLAELAILSSGDPYRGADLARGVRAVKERLWSRAYAAASVDPVELPDPATHTVGLELRVRAGPKVRLGRIRVFGNVWTRQNVILREFREGALPGDYLDIEALEEGRDRLYNLRYFSRVRFGDGLEPLDGLVKSPVAEDVWDVLLEVEESPDTRQFQFGVGVSTDGGAFANFGITWRNFDIGKPPTRFWGIFDADAFRGGGQTFAIQAQPGTERSQFNVSFHDPSVRDSRWSLGFRAFRSIVLYDDYDQLVDGLSVSVGRYLDPRFRWRIEFGWDLRQVVLDEPEPDAPVNALDAQGSTALHGLGLTVRYERLRGDRFLRGSVTSLGGQVFGGFLGADVDIVKVRFEQAFGWRFFRRDRGGWHRLIARFSADWATGYGDTDDVPIFERYFTGGLSLRGFQFREVGPRSNGRPEGSEAMLLLTMDYVIPLVDPEREGFGLDLVFFLDQAMLDRRLHHLDSDDYRASVGFGLAIAIGGPAQPPFQLNFGFPLRDRPEDQTQVVSLTFQRTF